MRKFLRKNPERYAEVFYGSPERFRTPLTSITQELLLCLKEGLIEKLQLISSYRDKYDSVILKDKEQKMQKTFGNFSETKIELTKTGKNKEGKYVPYRWQRINEICPDFDIFIDDNPEIIKESQKNLSADKIFVLPDYKTNRHVKGENIYHVKTTVSDLKDEDFVKAAEEYKNKKNMMVACTSKEREREREHLKATDFLLKNFHCSSD